MAQEYGGAFDSCGYCNLFVHMRQTEQLLSRTELLHKIEKEGVDPMTIKEIKRYMKLSNRVEIKDRNTSQAK